MARRRPSGRRAHKLPGYWNDLATLERELRAFAVEHGFPGMMPRKKDLSAAGRGDLLGAVIRHGGMHRVAERCGLDPARLRVPPGYWSDPATLRGELMAFIAEHGEEGVMPSREAMERAGRADLSAAVAVYGGILAVAERLGLEWRARQHRPGFWQQPGILEREVRAFVRQHGRRGQMPTERELMAAGRSDLMNVVRLRGGIHVVAKRLGLATRRARTARPKGYWHAFANLRREMLAYLDEQDLQGRLPSARRLTADGRDDLTRAIAIHGGFSAVAARMKLSRALSQRPRVRWQDLKTVARELRAFIRKHGRSGIMPTGPELVAAGHSGLLGGIKEHGGCRTVALRLGLQPRSGDWHTHDYWTDFANVERELRGYLKRHASGDVMPTSRELKAAKENGLIWAIFRHGGYRAVAKRLGLRRKGERTRPAGYWSDLANLERELRAYMEAHNLEDILPSARALAAEGQHGLISGIVKHGGWIAVARKLGLRALSQVAPAHVATPATKRKRLPPALRTGRRRG